MDSLKNFAYSNVAVAPVPATSGTALTVTTGQGAYFPTAPFDATIWPSGAQPTNTNAEIVRVTNVVSDVLTITRAQYGTTAQTITAGYQIAQTVDANLLNQLAPLTGATFTGEVVAPDFKVSGLTGATAATRYVGGTTNGAPTSGTFAVGDFIVDQTATIWVCTTAGTPGTWWSTISNHAVLRTATATAGKNEITIFSGSTASQTISAVGSPVDGATWTFINQGTVNVTAGFASNSMYPLGSGSSVTSYVIAPNSSYTFINYNGGQWYMTSTNDLDNGTGIVKVTNGGTGTSTAPAVGSIPVASSTSAYTPLAIGTSGQVLQSNGTTATWSSSTALATVNLTAQSAAQAATTLYTPASDGLFTITYYAKVTTAATTSSTLGVFSVISTDVDSNVVTTVGQSSQQNSLTAGFISGSITVYAKASTAIQYSLGYASSGATSMQYELHVVVAGTIAPSSTGTVSSFNGRTGAVTPGSSDYTASQVGALPTTTMVAGKNAFINSDFNVWQRGTSFSFNGGLYTADRCLIATPASGTASTVTQQSFAYGDIAGYNPSYFIRCVKNNTVSGGVAFTQRIEDVRTLSGQTVTLSFWAKGNIAFTNEPLTLQSFGSGGSADVYTTYTTQSITTSWARYSMTFTMPSVSGKTIGTGSFVSIYALRYTTSPDITIDTWGWQLEAGSIATQFTTATGTIQGELAACQRYYYRINGTGTTGGSPSGVAYSSNWAMLYATVPVTMRTNPSITWTAYGSTSVSTPYIGTYTPTDDWSVSTVGLNGFVFVTNHFSGLVTGQFLYWYTGNIYITAEL